MKNQAKRRPIMKPTPLHLSVQRDGEQTQTVTLEHDFATYLEGVLSDIQSWWTRRKKTGWPVMLADLEEGRVCELTAKSRGLFCHVEVLYALNGVNYTGLGYAKCSFDAFRIERGIGLALSRAIHDMLTTIILERCDQADKLEAVLA